MVVSFIQPERSHPRLSASLISAVKEFPLPLITEAVRLVQAVQDVVEGVPAAHSPEKSESGSCTYLDT